MSELTYTPVKDIPDIVNSLRKTFNTGLTKDLEFRKQQLANLLRFMNEKKEDLMDALYKDLHKHRMESNVGEISSIVDECQYMIKNVHRLSKPTTTNKRFKMNALDKTIIRKEPKGVVLVIGAWNYPVNLLLMPVVGAIAAGNCVLLKPSEVSANTAAVITKYLPDYLDKRAFSFVNGGVEETTVVLENKFDHIFYTGNGVVGKIVMKAAANYLTPVTLELGGKSPAIVAPDADLDVTANRLIWGKFFNNGQTCVAPDYVLVTKDMQEKLIVAIRRTLLKYYTANPQKCESYGRIVSTRQFDRLKGLLDHYDETQIAIGGKSDRDDLYMEPTVLKSISYKDEHIMQQEIFGPILPIIPVDNMEQAIQIINTRDHPLAMYIFAKSPAIYNNILNKTNSGGAVVNDTLMHLQELSLPFGGVGASGMGSYHGDKSFDTFVHERSTMIKTTGFESVLAARYPPYTDDKDTMLSFLIYGLPSTASAKFKTLMTVWSATWNIIFKKNSKL
ncbi:Aldehyde/histidinol dehydrogenase [Halteromyces radiatus]|uniref:Aldehyde/histidinol dehydrogenase n=1 Tax=Halteromyces radiatus TaxID=101107 RepID=UPI0022205C9D|nr:Aldehyde/histidinol dehydrogenase [Halteromyces radiatus]KAI8088724.1 Aldehyde/histidinol dehydrogenase [Halteromyces radiatus]